MFIVTLLSCYLYINCVSPPFIILRMAIYDLLRPLLVGCCLRLYVVGVGDASVI